MTIPEPDNEALNVDLHDLYDAVYTGLRLGEMSVRKLISRAYHAERERDQLQARVAELEDLVEDVLINERDGHLLPIELAGGACEWHARRSDAMKLEAKEVAGE